MSLSVVIPSYNPSLKLNETLTSLINQANLINELILVIDHHNFDKLPSGLIKKFEAIFNLKIVKQPDSGRGKSRNKGAEISTSDILMFLDDDMIAEKDLLQKHLQYHSNTPNMIVSGNGYRNPEDAKYDFGKFLVKMEANWMKTIKRKAEVSFNNFSFTACNMSTSKRVFQQLGGFDTQFSDGEDFDFAVRALNGNIRIMYDIDLLAWHNDWPEIETFINRQNEFGLARAAILKIHPGYIEHFPELKAREKQGFKKIIALVIRNTVGKWTISRKGLFNILPLKIKFLFYHSTIFANSNINNNRNY